MMKYGAIFLLFFFCITVEAQSRRVLFLGNSYTNSNNLPQLTIDAAASAGDVLITDQYTPGGYTLEGHSFNATSLSKIMAGNWDYVILQEQSQRPSFPLSQVETDVFPYAHALDSIINAYNACGETMFYMTWGRENGDALNCPTWPPVCTYEGMDSLLSLRYQMMAEQNHAVVSPVGAVWKFIRENYPSIDLYQGDGSHPSPSGSYAAACCFYTSIFRKDPSLITFDFGLDPTEAMNIRTAAKAVVFDSLLTWHLGEYELSSEFTTTQLSELTFQFNNISVNSTGQFWDFGMGTDTSTNPVYTFPGNGVYTVELTTYNDCDTLFFTAEVLVNTTGISSVNDKDGYQLFPNPTTGAFVIDPLPGYVYSIEIYNHSGIMVWSGSTLTCGNIDVSFLSPGLYHVKISVPGRNLVITLIKQ